jgi:hypothetical protein
MGRVRSLALRAEIEAAVLGVPRQLAVTDPQSLGE